MNINKNKNEKNKNIELNILSSSEDIKLNGNDSSDSQKSFKSADLKESSISQNEIDILNCHTKSNKYVIKSLIKKKKNFLLESHNHKIHEKFYNLWNIRLSYPSTLLIAISTFIGGLRAKDKDTFDVLSLIILIINGIATILSISMTFWKLGEKSILHATASNNYSDMEKQLKSFFTKSDLTINDYRNQEFLILQQEIILDKYKPNFGALGFLKPAKELPK